MTMHITWNLYPPHIERILLFLLNWCWKRLGKVKEVKLCFLKKEEGDSLMFRTAEKRKKGEVKKIWKVTNFATAEYIQHRTLNMPFLAPCLSKFCSAQDPLFPISLYQTVFSKNGDSNISHPSQSFPKVTLTLFHSLKWLYRWQISAWKNVQHY